MVLKKFLKIMSIITYKLPKNRKLTKEQLHELEIMDKSPIVSDPDIPDIKDLDLSRIKSIGQLKKEAKLKTRKRVEAIIASDAGGSNE